MDYIYPKYCSNSHLRFAVKFSDAFSTVDEDSNSSVFELLGLPSAYQKLMHIIFIVLLTYNLNRNQLENDRHDSHSLFFSSTRSLFGIDYIVGILPKRIGANRVLLQWRSWPRLGRQYFHEKQCCREAMHRCMRLRLR